MANKHMQNKLNTTTAIDIDEHLKRESIFRIGTVHSVSGRKIKVEVFKNKNHPYLIYDGEITKNVATGSYLKIKKGLTTIIGKIEGEEIYEEKIFNDKYGKDEARIKRFLNVSLYGHYEDGRFYQGIKEMPLRGNECYVIDKEDFEKLHKFFDEGEHTISIGRLSEDPSHVIRASINKLFANHIGIFGNTGSGKSNTLARIYTELFEKARDFQGFRENSHFIFIDFNGEYAHPKVISENKKILILNTRKEVKNISDDEKYPISQKSLEDPEILAVLLHATEKTQKPFLENVLNSSFLKDHGNYANSTRRTLQTIIDRKLTEGISKILGFLDLIKIYVTDEALIENLASQVRLHLTQDARGSYMWDGTYNKQNSLDIWPQHIEPTLSSLVFKDNLHPIDDLQLRIYLNYYFKLSFSRVNAEFVGHMINRVDSKFKMLKKVIRVSDDLPVENMVVVSLRKIRLEMKKILPLMICKHLYEVQKQRNEEKEKIESSLHIIIDEAHNILSEESERESELWKDYRLETFEEIIKEGRKFGTFLTIASQRPHDISQTILSQLHNYFVHKLINTYDLEAVRKAVAYLDDLSFDTIPILSVGSCFFAGLATDIPIKINIELLDPERQPRSETVKLTDAWSRSSNQSSNRQNE